MIQSNCKNGSVGNLINALREFYGSIVWSTNQDDLVVTNNAELAIDVEVVESQATIT